MEKELFDDLIAACHEAIAHEKGKIKLKSNVVTIPDDDVDFSYLIYQKIAGMTDSNKQRVAGYVDGLLQATNG